MGNALALHFPESSIRDFVELLGKLTDEGLKHQTPLALRDLILDAEIASGLVEIGEVDFDEFKSLLTEHGLGSGTSMALNYAFLVITGEIKARKAQRDGTAEEEEEEEEVEEPVEEEEEEDETSGFAKIVDYFIENHTYKPELQNVYFVMLDKHRNVARVHQMVVQTKTRATDSWEYTKAKIKAFLALLGLDAVFVALNMAAERNRVVRHVFKVLGTIAMPVIVLTAIVLTLMRIMANPFQRFFRWLSKELDFKMPGEEEEGAL